MPVRQLVDEKIFHPFSQSNDEKLERNENNQRQTERSQIVAIGKNLNSLPRAAGPPIVRTSASNLTVELHEFA